VSNDDNNETLSAYWKVFLTVFIKSGDLEPSLIADSKPFRAASLMRLTSS